MKNLLIILTFIAINNNLNAAFVVNIDAAVFSHAKDSIVWELYYSFNNDDLSYVEMDSLYVAEVFFDVFINSGLDNVEQKWIFTNAAANYEGTKNLLLFGVKKIFLKEGQYEVSIKINDINQETSHAKHNFKLITPSYKYQKIEASDIQLAKLGVLKSESKVLWDKMFDKRDYFIIPNPQLEYYDYEKTLKFYYEIYNAKYFSKEGIRLNYEIIDPLNNSKLDTSILETNLEDLMQIYQEIDLSELATGVYYLKSSILYPIEEPTDSLVRLKKFYFMNKNKAAESPDIYYAESQKFEHSEFAAMSPEQIEHELEIIKIVASQYDVEKMEQLSSLKAKQRFLYQYWLSQDPEPSTIQNERLIEIRKAEEFANTYFTWGSSKNGWKTDRGRVLLKYGFPTDIEREVANANLRAWTEWWYSDIQGGVRFYFVDMGGFGDFKLVHSTAAGELFFIDWYNQFVPDSRGNPFDE